jgi:hypothetical protein
MTTQFPVAGLLASRELNSQSGSAAKLNDGYARFAHVANSGSTDHAVRRIKARQKIAAPKTDMPGLLPIDHLSQVVQSVQHPGRFHFDQLRHRLKLIDENKDNYNALSSVFVHSAWSHHDCVRVADFQSRHLYSYSSSLPKVHDLHFYLADVFDKIESQDLTYLEYLTSPLLSANIFDARADDLAPLVIDEPLDQTITNVIHSSSNADRHIARLNMRLEIIREDWEDRDPPLHEAEMTAAYARAFFNVFMNWPVARIFGTADGLIRAEWFCDETHHLALTFQSTGLIRIATLSEVKGNPIEVVVDSRIEEAGGHFEALGVTKWIGRVPEPDSR